MVPLDLYLADWEVWRSPLSQDPNSTFREQRRQVIQPFSQVQCHQHKRRLQDLVVLPLLSELRRNESNQNPIF